MGEEVKKQKEIHRETPHTAIGARLETNLIQLLSPLPTPTGGVGEWAFFFWCQCACCVELRSAIRACHKKKRREGGRVYV